MDAAERERLEDGVRQACAAADFQRAATLAIRGYGPEILGWLVAVQRSEAEAGDVFSVFSEGLWRGLPEFGWSCTLRTWAYTLARHASIRHAKGTRRRAARQVPLAGRRELSQLEQQVRSETLSYLRTATKTRIAELRATLPEQDQTLLILRVDRGLPWSDLARILLTESGEPTEQDLKREAARLRKRFQAIKDTLFELGRREGLVGGRQSGR